MKKYVVGIYCVIFFTLLGCLVWYIFLPQSLLSRPEKTAALTKLLGRAPQLAAPVVSEKWNTYTDAYISFMYPVNADMRPTDSNPKILTNKFFLIPQSRLQVSVQVLDGKDVASLDEVSGVSLRKNQGGYVAQEIKMANISGMSFLKTDETVEKTAFFLSNGKVYSFAVTGYSREDVAAMMEKILNSVKI